MPKTSDKNMLIEVNTEQLAAALGVSVRRISQLYQEGIAIKTKPGRYDLIQTNKNYIETFKKPEKETDVKKIELATSVEKLKHEQAKRKKTELQVKQLEKNLLSAAAVEKVWCDMATVIRTRLMAIPSKISAQLLMIDEQATAQNILRREISDVLNELANYDVDAFEYEFETVTDDERE